VRQRIAILLLTVVVLAPALMVRADQTSAPSYDKGLARLKRDFVRILRERRTTEFLSYIGPQGVSIDENEDSRTRKDIGNDFRRKRGAYCVLFDSRCLGGDSQSVCSAHGLLLTAKPEVTVSVAMPEGKPQAYLSIASKARSCLDGTQSYEFIFARVQGSWNLIAVSHT